MSTEEEFLIKRMKDLASLSYRTGQFTYTGFLSPSEQAIYYQIHWEKGDPQGTFFGGTMGCERQILRFGEAEVLGYDAGYPVKCIEIQPVLKKFSDKLTHRDFLGALMHLGIERNTVGDIVCKENTAYVFCLDKVSEYILENLSQIKHTCVKCKELTEVPEAVQPKLVSEKIIVPSMRYDVVIAKLCHLSRSQSISLFREKKVFVNGKQMENNSGILKEEDVVSIRGYGKFIYQKFLGETKKGNLNISVSKYV